MNTARYSELYLNGDEEINVFCPDMYLAKTIDCFNQSTLYICNREPYCDCTTDCMCDDDDYANIAVSGSLLSQCKFDLAIRMTAPYKLINNYEWKLFSFSDNDSENTILTINTIDGTLLFNVDGMLVRFTSQEKIKSKKESILIQFDYMSFELL